MTLIFFLFFAKFARLRFILSLDGNCNHHAKAYDHTQDLKLENEHTQHKLCYYGDPKWTCLNKDRHKSEWSHGYGQVEQEKTDLTRRYSTEERALVLAC